MQIVLGRNEDHVWRQLEASASHFDRNLRQRNLWLDVKWFESMKELGFHPESYTQ